MIVSREFRFEAAHRLPHHGGKCKHLHGHSYRVEVSVSSPINQDTGISIDFGDLKPLGKWIDDNLDHATLVWSGDESMLSFLESEGQKHFVTSAPPTAEILSLKIRLVAAELLPSVASVTTVRVWETVNCSAIAGVS